MSARQHDALAAALREEYGEVVVAVYTMPGDELEALVEAVRMIEREADDRWQAESEHRHLSLVSEDRP